MFPLALPAALAGLSKGKWIAIGIAALILLAAIGGLFVWAKVEAARADELAATLKAAELERDLYKGDAERWQAASAELVKVNAANIAAFDAARADLARSAADAIAAAQQAEQLAADAAAKLAKLKGKANATPGDVHPVGPVVRDGLEWLRCRQQAGAGADSAACPGSD